jgi:hypothetical protein
MKGPESSNSFSNSFEYGNIYMRNSHVFLCHKSEHKIILISESGWSPSARTKHDRYEPRADSTLHGVVFEILRPVPVVHCRGAAGSTGLTTHPNHSNQPCAKRTARALQPLRRLVSLNQAGTDAHDYRSAFSRNTTVSRRRGLRCRARNRNVHATRKRRIDRRGLHCFLTAL